MGVFVASAVGRTKPDLFYFLANRNARRGIKVQLMDEFIGVIRPASLVIIRLARKSSLYLVNISNQYYDFIKAVTPLNFLRGGKLYKLVEFSTPRFHNIAGFDDFPVMCPSLTESHATNQEAIDFAALEPSDIVFDFGSYNGLTSIAFSNPDYSLGGRFGLASVA